MKYLLFFFLMVFYNIVLSQNKKEYFFDIVWEDSSISTIKIYEYLDSTYGLTSYYSLSSNDDFEINAFNDVSFSKKRVNPNPDYCSNDSLTYFSPIDELYLNESYNYCYYLDAFNNGYIRFRKISDTTLSGRIFIYAPHFTACVSYYSGGCFYSVHVPIIFFQSYKFDSNQEIKNISLVSGIKSMNLNSFNYTVSPNPFTSSIKVLSDKRDIVFTLYSLEGNILTKDIKANTEIDLRNLNPGIYILRSSENSICSKIVKY